MEVIVEYDFITVRYLKRPFQRIGSATKVYDFPCSSGKKICEKYLPLQRSYFEWILCKG